MLGYERMFKHPITTTKGVFINQALKFMRDEKVRRLPVLNKKGKLVDVISERDLMYASPSPTTSLSIYEFYYLEMF